MINYVISLEKVKIIEILENSISVVSIINFIFYIFNITITPSIKLRGFNLTDGIHQKSTLLEIVYPSNNLVLNHSSETNSLVMKVLPPFIVKGT